MIDRDQLNSLPPKETAHRSFALLDKAQDWSPEFQLVATAALFLMLCQHHGIDTQDVMTVTKNLMVSEGERHEAFRAISDFMRYEL